ncbi:MAG: TSUP family transporter, partial [Pseudomonadota bacterium]
HKMSFRNRKARQPFATDILWDVFWRYMLGAVGGLGLLFLVAWRPDKSDVYLILSLIPIVIWIPRSWFHLDIRRPGQAEFTGFLVQAMNTLAGVAGPILDVFFANTDMTRQQVVATKSATQTISHIIKISFWSAPLILAADVDHQIWPPIWLLALAIPIAMLATYLGKNVLERMQDSNFRIWVKSLVTVIGLIYAARAAGWI